jgi:hypothetical protein
MQSVELNQNDFASATWQKLRLRMESRLEMLRRRNDSDLTPDETARIRGQIAELKATLALEEDPAKPTTAGVTPLS